MLLSISSTVLLTCLANRVKQVPFLLHSLNFSVLRPCHTFPVAVNLRVIISAFCGSVIKTRFSFVNNTLEI